MYTKLTFLESYCDDNTLTSSTDSLEKAIKIAQKDSENIIKIFRLNKLACNIVKLEVLVLRRHPRKPKNKVTLEIDGTPVTEKDTFKIVGLRISNKLDFKLQIEYLTKSVNQKNWGIKGLVIQRK